MKKRLVWSMLLCILLAALPLLAQASEPLPADPNLKIGKLANGLTYYIRHNEEPKNRVSLRLAVKVGSLQEDDDQLGLAHFVEHMCFNGTKHFKKQELVDYLEKIGTRFGADLNAETSFESTVYQLQLPTDSPEILEKAFLILQDWASAVTFDASEIDKERGVVIEEWRGSRGAQARVFDKQFPLLFHDSRYAKRLPIGEVNILQTAPREAFERFFRDWYRPDLMAVMVVGDLDPAKAEAMINTYFAGLKNPESPRNRDLYPVPDHDETLFGINTDPELTRSLVELYYKHPAIQIENQADYRNSLVRLLNQNMLSDRLSERAQQANPPFVAAYASYSNLVATKDAFSQGAMVKADKFDEALRGLIEEGNRVREFGFTATELERHKKDLLHNLEQAYKERDKTSSERLIDEYVRNFISKENIPGIENELALFKKFLPGITLDEVNAQGREWITAKNRVVLVSAPEKEGFAVPSREQILASLAAAEKAPVTAYVDSVSEADLIETPPKPGKVVAEKQYAAVGVTEWTLSNGAKVFLKPTDFKNDQILFSATSLGGSSLVADATYIPATTAAMLVDSSGLGAFDSIQLEKKLAGKTVSLQPYINELEEGFSGSTSPDDLETMLQLLYLYFTKPQVEERVFASLTTRYSAVLENREADPSVVFEDEIEKTLYGNHLRRQPFDKKTIAKMDGDSSLNIFRERFQNGGDFQYMFVGNFQLDQIKPLVEAYVGGLNPQPTPENWKDVGADCAKGPHQISLDRGLEPKSSVKMMFYGDAPWTIDHRYHLVSLNAVLNMRLREILREEMGGVYGVSVSGSLIHFPKEQYQTTINFDCDPKMVDSLVSATIKELERAAKEGFDATYLEKVKETQLRTFEVNLRRNEFWISNLGFYIENGEDLNKIVNLPKRIEALTGAALQEAVVKYFNQTNYLLAVLKPAPGVAEK